MIVPALSETYNSLKCPVYALNWELQIWYNGIITAFQAEDAGSIPAICYNYLRVAHGVVHIVCKKGNGL